MSERTHAADCPWELSDCEWKRTHYYCPHPHHACTCPAFDTVGELKKALVGMAECLQDAVDLAYAGNLPNLPLISDWKNVIAHAKRVAS